MDTLSRDSNGSGSVLPLVGVIAGALGLILAIVALVKLSTLQKTVNTHGDEIVKIAKIDTIENDLRAATSKSESDLRGLRQGVQDALNDVGTQIGTLRAQVTKVEEAQKARPAAAAAGGKAGAAAAPTGVLNPDGTYTIAPGDTFSKIARKFSVRMDAIEAENPGLDPSKLRPGQKIRIPRK
jgi:nucleoid-associated protein YgaU